MPKSRSALVRTLEDHRMPLATALLAGLAGWSKFPEADSTDPAARDAFVRNELLVFIDYITLFFKRDETAYRDLYIGEKLKQCYDPRDSAEDGLARRKAILQSDHQALLAYLGPLLNEEERRQFVAFLDDAAHVVTGETKRQVKVLFVGDCMHLDIVAFLAAPLLEQGLRLESTFATSKNPVELHRSLRALEGRSFDLVFYSPFSYEFHPEYTQLQFLRSAALAAEKLDAILRQAKSDTLGTMRVLGALFEAPIFVHNSIGIRRHDNSLQEVAKNLLTQRTRAIGRRSINAWLPGELDKLNLESFPHFFLLDEAALLGQHSEHGLARHFYDVSLQHPAELGRAIARLYLDIILAVVLLMKKKVAVCDLDNTLWQGVIGEGAVRHYLDRQTILKQLRNKGVLLAINSKNDPKNVHWDGAALLAEDFVSAQINWGAKVQNLRRIAEELNLKAKDFFFLDDRADERAMVAETMPEVLTLDAEEPAVWRRLRLAAELLPEQDEMDRTLAYHQRAERQQFLEDPAAAAAEQRELFRRLEFRVGIRTPEAKELKRVAELINRTNQFNMCGARTSLAELSAWNSSTTHEIFVVDARDKFGSMGTVCVAVIAETSAGMEIVAFVLSCRVFGYGVETALLNHLKRGANGRPILGRYVETAFNEPCRQTYAQNGFDPDGDRWVYSGAGQIEDPDWMTVDVAMTV